MPGGRGSGKSWSLSTFFLYCSIVDIKRILCTREIQKTIKDSVHKLLSDTIDRMGWNKLFDITIDSIKSFTGSSFIFKGLHNNPDDIKSLEGIDMAWVEEAQRVSRRSLDTLIPTIRKDGSQIYFSYNPTNESDPVHQDFTLSKRQDMRIVEMNYGDNPYFPEVLRKEMEYDRLTDTDKYFHIWEGKCIKHSQAQVFYGKWSIDIFDPPQDTLFYFGLDFGYRDPTAIVRCYIHDMILFIDYDKGGVEIDIDKIPELLHSIPDLKLNYITADNARPETISYISKQGFNVRAAEKPRGDKGSVKDGIAKIRSFHKIVIHERCKHVIDEFQNYSYKIDPLTGDITDTLEDKHNHYIDALRYALEKVNIGIAKELMNRFGIQV